MKFVTVTCTCESHFDGHDWYLNPEHIVLIQRHKNTLHGCEIVLVSGESITIRENFDECVSLFPAFLQVPCLTKNNDEEMGLLNLSHVICFSGIEAETGEDDPNKCQANLGGGRIIICQPLDYVLRRKLNSDLH